MSAVDRCERVLTEPDFARLSRIDRRRLPPELAHGLDSADIVAAADIARNVITMNSSFVIEDRESAQRTQWTLCYPDEADPAKGHISVLSPAGGSVLGLRHGATALWRTPQGTLHQAVIAAVLDPDSAGDACAA